MSILSRIKSILPVSSRSAHAMHEDIFALRSELTELKRELRSADSRAMTLLWENLRKEGESITDTKKRFFKELDPAEGPMRTYQLAATKLLHDFDEFCEKNDLSYWVASGTLLGCVRHGAFIPWDDDLDVGMCRQDILRALECVRDDERFAIDTRFDYHYRCRQYHFRYADESIPCFIDLFIYDPIKVDPAQALEVHKRERELLRQDVLADELLSSWEGDSLVFEEQSEQSRRLRELFDSHLSTLYADGGICTESLDGATGVIWALDNIDGIEPDHSWYPITKDKLVPFARAKFEDIEVWAPADAYACAQDHYGDIYELPFYVGAYFDHLSHEELASPGVQDKLLELLGKKDYR